MTTKLAAFGVSAAALFASLFFGFVTVAYGCHGSDVSSGPVEGSTGDLLCTFPAAALHLGLGLVAIFAPIVAVGAGKRGFRLSTALAVSSGAIAALAVVGTIISSWNDLLFTYPLVALFAAALFYRLTQGSE